MILNCEFVLNKFQEFELEAQIFFAQSLSKSALNCCDFGSSPKKFGRVAGRL